MAERKCPMCDSNCLLKVIANEDSRLCEVDVCSMCGTMYPREEGDRRGKKTREGEKSRR